jgi:hypothetical protein
MQEVVLIILAVAALTLAGITMVKSFKQPSPRDVWFFELIRRCLGDGHEHHNQ